MAGRYNEKYWEEKLVAWPHSLVAEINSYADEHNSTFSGTVRTLVQRSLEEERQKRERQEVAVK